MPSKRNGLAAAALNHEIYILGGKINDNYTNTMEAYDPGAKKWEKKASMKKTRANFCVSAKCGIVTFVMLNPIFHINIFL